MVPAFGEMIWDTSTVLTDNSLLGKTLHTLIGYEAEPSGIQLIAYLVTLVTIGGLTWRLGRVPMAARNAAPAAR